MRVFPGDVLSSPTGRSGETRLARVLLCDDIAFVYDAWWEGLGWGLRKIRKNAAGYYASVASLDEWELLREEPLTFKEKAAYRPDLPMRLCRHPTLNWADFKCDAPDQIPEALARLKVDHDFGEAIESPAISVLFAPGHSEVIHSVKVEARDERSVLIVDLLWHAQKLMADQGFEAPDGIGLFRMLRWAGLPGYLVGGYHNFSTWAASGGDPRLQPEWTTRRKPITGDFKARLKGAKRLYPFASWRSGDEDGLGQYSKENCDAAKAIVDRLIKKLTLLGDQAPEQTKLELFREAVESLNGLDAEVGNLIETGEREQLCELFNEIARAVDLDPSKYGGGEGPASQWRDW